MSNKNQNGPGILLTTVGTMFLIVGILFATYEHVRTQTVVFNTIVETSYGYPFQPYGFILMFVGMAFLISGIYLWQIKNQKKNKTMPKWWKPYWISLLVLVTIIAVLRFVFRTNQFDKLIWLTIFSYSLLGFSYYVRVNPPSLRTNKMMYRGLLGFLFGWIIWIILYATRVVSYLIYVVGFDEGSVIVLTLGISFVGGVVVGDLVGRYRNYKGPEQYSPL